MMYAQTLRRPALRFALAAAGLLTAVSLHGAGHTALIHGPRTVAATADVSTNWAGYVDETNGVDSVSGTWVVPTVTPSAGTSASSVWVGIGGSNSDDLIQAGTEQDIENGRAVYYAWYEMLPAESKQVRMDVEPGDQITVAITETARSQWVINMSDDTTGEALQMHFTYRSSNASAEWIVEAPTAINSRTGAEHQVTLANFGAVHFSNMAATTSGQAIDPTESYPVVMASHRAKLVDVSPVQDGGFDALYLGSNPGNATSIGNQ